MKHIILNKWYKKLIYIIGTFGVIISPVLWLVQLLLINYFDDEIETEMINENRILNKKYQKVIYYTGIIMLGLVSFGIIDLLIFV